MRQDRTAVMLAIDLMNMPSRVRIARNDPLPEGVEAVLRLAAGEIAAADGGASAEAEQAARNPRSPIVQREAATFFIEQILLAPDADSYRVLGGDSETPNEELRRNMALLVRWLHPDLGQSGERSVFARRVTAAWEDVKTVDRRNAYDARQRRSGTIATTDGGRGHQRTRRAARRQADIEATLAAPAGLRGVWHRLARRFLFGRRPS